METQQPVLSSPIEQTEPTASKNPLTINQNLCHIKLMSKSNLLLIVLLIITTALLGIEAYFALKPKTSPSAPQAIQPSTTTVVDSKR